MIYDIFYVSKDNIDEQDWKQFRSRFPSSQKIENVKSFDDIKKKAFTKFFWIVWNDLTVVAEFNFEYCITVWDTEYIHVWKNSEHYDGIALASKNHKITQQEFDYRFYINKKEIDVVASNPKKYDIVQYDTYDEYLNVIVGKTSMVWLVPAEALPRKDFAFDLYFSWHNKFDRNMNHVFLHAVGEKQIYNGIMLVPSHKLLSKREIDFRFPVDKKKYSVVASDHIANYDIVFISYYEPNADANYNKLKERFPNAKRIDGVKGIHQAHIKAAEIASSSNFWVVDGDADIEDSFNFDYPVSKQDKDTVYVWESRNPINDLIYGYGGVKLLPRELTANMDIQNPDMTTSISDSFKIISKISNVTKFNVDEFSTWRSAFRECAKLASRVIDRNFDDETDERLHIWCNVGKDRPFGEYAINGARAGKQFGEEHIQDPAGLNLINDYKWLKNQFDQIKDKIK